TSPPARRPCPCPSATTRSGSGWDTWRTAGPARRPAERAAAERALGPSPSAGSALDDVDGQSAAGGLLVRDLHVGARLLHGLDDLVEGDMVAAVAAQRHAGRGHGLDRGHAVALDAGDLDQAAHRVAGEAEVVLHADLGRVLDLF